MSSALNWLNSYRLFLDHEESSLKRRFGKQSSQYLAFKAACAKAYDTSPEYRFTYKLRNYATHVEMPISRVSLRRPSPEDLVEGLSQRIAFTLDRDDLLANYDWGVAATADLEKMDAEFELLPPIEPTMLQLMAVSRSIVAVSDCAGGITWPRYATSPPTPYA